MEALEDEEKRQEACESSDVWDLQQPSFSIVWDCKKLIELRENFWSSIQISDETWRDFAILSDSHKHAARFKFSTRS